MTEKLLTGTNSPRWGWGLYFDSFILRKINFLDMKILWIICLSYYKIGLVLGVISMYFKALLKVNVQNVDIFGGCKNFKYFLGCLIFLISFFSCKQ